MALNAHYRRLLDDPHSGIAVPGYSQEKISFVIVLSRDGAVADVNDLRDLTGPRPTPRTLAVPQPEKRTSGVKSNFLWDKTGYVLGLSTRLDRTDQEHDAFKTFHLQALADTADIGLQALLAFIDHWSPKQFESDPQFVRHGQALLDTNVVFRLDGDQQYIHERTAARVALQRLRAANKNGAKDVCLVTADLAPIARLHPAIKGVNGAQSSGASLISFNLDAFTSYGKDQGENAPVSEQAAFAYTTALNHLLRRDERNRQRLQIGDTTVVFWAQGTALDEAIEAEDVMSLMLGAGETDEQATQHLLTLLQQVRQMRPLRDLNANLREDTQVFVLGLAPNASRLSIRYWETGTLVTFARRLAEHYHDLELDPPAWRRPPSLQYLALQTAPIHGEPGKVKHEDISPLLAGELTRSVLSGVRYPRSLLGNIVMRFRADGHVTPLRVALCKAVLARDARLNKQQGRSIDEEEPPVSLDPTNTNAGYLLGRLFSALESVQRAALGKDVNATIRDRYYGAASATPASIFPVLLRNTQNHLGKVRKDKAGLAVTLEKEIGKIVDALPPSLPRSLTIEDQGRFAIGYYHQTQLRFSRENQQDTTDTDSQGEPE